MLVRPAVTTLGELLTINQMATEIGLSTRTIRTYHSRGLLPPPIRIGRTPYYGRVHLARMRYIVRLQRRGLPLEAVRAVLEPDLVLGEYLLPRNLLAAALRTDPGLFSALTGAGVLARRPDGGLAVRGPRAVLAVRAACPSGVPLGHALHVLADAVAAMAPLATAALTRVRAELARRWPEVGEDELLDLTVEVVRLALLHAVADAPSAGSIRLPGRAASSGAS